MRTALCFLISFALAALVITGVRHAAADDAGVTLIEPMAAGSAGPALAAGSAASDTFDASTTVQPPAVTVNAESGSTVNVTPAETDPQVERVGILTKLWRNGVIFAFGLVAAYVGLTVWAKVDKKRAFYATQALGGLTLLIDSIPRGDTPNATTIAVMILPTIGILIAGPQLRMTSAAKA